MLLSRHVLKVITRNHVNGCFSYCTKSNQKKKPSLYAKISPLGNPNVNVTPELQKWVEDGKKVRFAELQRIIYDLRKRKRFAHALQVSEWVKSTGSYNFTPAQHAVHLDLIGKVHGLTVAESFFNGLNEQDKTEKAYGALLHCYVRQRQSEKALMHFKEMKENGIPLSSVAFNDIMCLHLSIGKNEMVPSIFTKMKENGVQPDNLSYRICINSYGERSDIEGVENMLHKMENDDKIVMDWNTYAVVANFYIKLGLESKANSILGKAEERLNKRDGDSHNHLISLHARLGNNDDVLRLWIAEKKCKKCLNRDYMNMMEALVRLSELEEAEKLLTEWESSGNCFDFRVPSVVILGCIENGLLGKARSLLEHLVEIGKETASNHWGKLAVGYLEKGEIEDGLSSIKTMLLLHDSKEKMKLDEKIVTAILSLVGEKVSYDDAEEIFGSLRSLVPFDKQMYHAFLKSCVRSGKEVNTFLQFMKAENFDEDDETLKILSGKHEEVL